MQRRPRKDTRTNDQLKLSTAKTLVRVLIKAHPNAELVARANRWLERS